LNHALVKKAFALLPGNIVNVAGFHSQPGGNVSGDVLEKGSPFSAMHEASFNTGIPND
jgi:hypothetical protein